MDFYFSGTARNDAFMIIENRLIKNRLLSLHGDYIKAAHRWLDILRNAPTDLTGYLSYIGASEAALRKRDERFEKKYGAIDLGSWESLRAMDSHVPENLARRKLMLDSGAFTAWSSGNPTTLDAVSAAYESTLRLSEGLFLETWLINLDTIPGERGRSGTPDEINAAMEESLRNHEVLTERFGNIVLPVFHQDEPFSYLDQLLKENDYICVSPRNDLHETHRIDWATLVLQYCGDTRCHGLAVLGAEMSKAANWASGDSAAWMINSNFGMLDIAVFGEQHRAGESIFKSFKVSDRKIDLRASEETLIEARLAEIGLCLSAARTDYRLREISNIHNRNLLEDHFRRSKKRPVQQRLF